MLNESRSDRAILVVDMINEYANEGGKSFIPASREIIPYILGELQYFRERMRPVIFCNTQWDGADLRSEVIRELSPRTKEISLNKSRPNAFFNTELTSILQQLKVKNVTIVGVPFHTSILLSAASALDYGFSVVVPETCVCSSSEQDYAASLRIVNRWLASE